MLPRENVASGSGRKSLKVSKSQGLKVEGQLSIRASSTFDFRLSTFRLLDFETSRPVDAMVVLCAGILVDFLKNRRPRPRIRKIALLESESTIQRAQGFEPHRESLLRTFR